MVSDVYKFSLNFCRPSVLGLAVVLGAICSTYQTATAAGFPHHFMVFSIKEAPTPGDWRRFHQLSPVDLKGLWAYHHRLGRNLASWSWQWRLAWVRRCTHSRWPTCGTILRQGLGDRALVVRAETASRLGQRYEGNERPEVIRALARAYRDRRNYRRGRPLMVQNRILFALRQIGGRQALATAKTLASDHADTMTYWTKVTLPDAS